MCFGGPDASTATQAVYNVMATGAETLLPGIFSNDGVIAIAPRRILVSLVLLSMALVGWRQGPRLLRLTPLIVGINAVQSFLLFRSRNHVVATCAMGVAAGLGFSIVSAGIQSALPSRRIRALALAPLLVLLSVRARETHALVVARVQESVVPDGLRTRRSRAG